MGHDRSILHLATRAKVRGIVAFQFRECATETVGPIAVASLDGFAGHGVVVVVVVVSSSSIWFWTTVGKQLS